MRINGIILLSTMFVASTFLLAGCSLAPLPCDKNNAECAPTPLRAQIDANHAVENHKNNPNKTQRNAILDNSDEVSRPSSDSAKKRYANVKVIESIRNPEPNTQKRPNTQIKSQLSKQQFSKRLKPEPSLSTSYTIQIGAYKKVSSLEHVVSMIDSKSDLFVFPMKNKMLGLAYGQFKTIKEAKAQQNWLIKHEISDFQIRPLPTDAQPLQNLAIDQMITAAL